MHEMGIAAEILDAVEREARAYPHQRPTLVAVRIGEFAGVDPEALRFSFEALTRPHGPKLTIEWTTVAGGHQGDELEIAYLELDDELVDESEDASADAHTPPLAAQRTAPGGIA